MILPFVRGSQKTVLRAFALAVPFSALANMNVLLGWLNAPEGFLPAGVPQGQDTAQYVTWITAFRTQNLISNHHLPWETEPGYFHPLFWLEARLSVLTGIGYLWWFEAFEFLSYFLAWYSLLTCLDTFLENQWQRFWAWIAIVCALPLRALAAFPWFIADQAGSDTGRNLIGRALRASPDEIPGFFHFGYLGDGFIHSLSSNPSVTTGTALTLAAFALLGKYVETLESHYLRGASLVAFLCGFLHPFEVFVIVGAGSLTLLVVHGREWARGLRSASLLGIAGVAGLSPYLFASLKHEWVRDAGVLNRWEPWPLTSVLHNLGLPALLVLVLFAVRPRMTAARDLLLQAWFGIALMGLYVPWMPWALHLLDGFTYCTAILLVRQCLQVPLARSVWTAYPRLCRTAVFAICTLSLAAYGVYVQQRYHDASRPGRRGSTVASRDRIALEDWFRAHSKPGHLVLAPREDAPWIATVPVHSFASHHLFSFTKDEQDRISDSFFAGRLDLTTAQRFIDEFGIRFVAAPESSIVITQLARMTDAVNRAMVGSYVIFEFPANRMKPYPGLEEARRIIDGFRPNRAGEGGENLQGGETLRYGFYAGDIVRGAKWDAMLARPHEPVGGVISSTLSDR